MATSILRKPLVNLKATFFRSFSRPFATESVTNSTFDLVPAEQEWTVNSALSRSGKSATKSGHTQRIKIYPTPLNRPITKTPLAVFTQQQINLLDPNGTRQRLFDRKNKDAIAPGDILQVRFKDPNVEPFAGVLLNIRRRGLDTGFLLRSQLTRISMEMWYKLYSPLIEGIDLVKRKERRARRAKLTYMRKPEHDIGSVEGIVREWKKSRALFTAQTSGRGGRMAGKENKHYKRKAY